MANPEQISNRDVLPLSESPSLPHVLTLWSVASPSLFLTGSVTSLQTLSVWSVGWSVYYLERQAAGQPGRAVTLPCSCRITCFLSLSKDYRARLPQSSVQSPGFFGLVASACNKIWAQNQVDICDSSRVEDEERKIWSRKFSAHKKEWKSVSIRISCGYPPEGLSVLLWDKSDH